jgi:hypothetical protein
MPTVTFTNSASIQPVGAVEKAVASIAGGPFVAVDAYVSGGTPGVQLQFKLYAVVGGLRTAIANAVYAGPGVIGSSVLEWTVIDQPDASIPVIAGATQYDLVVLATSPIGVAGAAILATLAGTNEYDANVLAASSPATPITNVGCAQLADVGASLSGTCDVDLFVSCGGGSVEGLVRSVHLNGVDGLAAIMRQVPLPVGTQYRAAVRNGSLSSMSLATYSRISLPTNVSLNVVAANQVILTPIAAPVPIAGKAIIYLDIADGVVKIAGSAGTITPIGPA